MSQIRPRLPVLGLLARSVVVPAALLLAANMVMVMFIPVLHMVEVGVAGALAASCAIWMSVIAARRNDGRAVWIGMAFSVIAMMLVIHGLATPGVILPDNGLVQVAGALNLPVCGTILAAACRSCAGRATSGGCCEFRCWWSSRWRWPAQPHWCSQT